jgi:uncharacterized membrane protein
MPNENEPIKNKQDIEDNKTMAALSYVWILFLVPLFGKRDSEFAQFHAKQGLILFVIEVLAGLLVWFPIFGQLLMLALVIIAIIGIVKTLNGEYWKIPYIYEWSQKIKF